MNANKKNDEIVNAILKDTHRETEPPDSWEALRTRIDHRIDNRKSSSLPLAQQDGSVVFWRRIALAMAACFLLTAGLLVRTIGFVQRGKDSRRQHATTTNQGLFSPAQLNQLNRTFSNVRELFGQQLPWIVVGAGSNAEIGVDEMVRREDISKVIVVRLALNLEKQKAGHRYFDVVTFSDQLVNCKLLLAENSAIAVSLKPIIRKDGIIAVEINARVNGSSESRSITTLRGNTFTSLVRLRANGEWVNIDGIAQSMSSI
jgi:hypothetical protein